MTNNLKCPFCAAELEKEEETRKWFHCVNERCPHKYTSIHETILRELIDGKAAQDALNGIAKILLLHTNKPTVLTVKGKQEIRRRLASITTQELNK